MRQWTPEEAWDWQERHGWLVGFNYLPRTAGNWLDMWQDGDFAPEIIDQELGWAREMGYNSLRTNLSFQVWQEDREGLLERLETFLSLCERHDLAVILTPLDDCEFSDQAPIPGRQPEPMPGIHNSIAVGSPGRDIVCDPARWGDLETFMKDILSLFAHDRRIICWDLYNEPTNRMIFSGKGDDVMARFPESCSHELMKRAFQWAREIAPSQPLTVAAWHIDDTSQGPGKHFDHATDRLAMELSDVISFHAYTTNEELERAIEIARGHGRPVMCTEWMARHLGSTIEKQLPVFKAAGVGCFQWGLVNGKTQTHLPWPHLSVRDDQRGLWFHDLLQADGTPFREEEVECLRRQWGGV